MQPNLVIFLLLTILCGVGSYLVYLTIRIFHDGFASRLLGNNDASDSSSYYEDRRHYDPEQHYDGCREWESEEDIDDALYPVEYETWTNKNRFSTAVAGMDRPTVVLITDDGEEEEVVVGKGKGKAKIRCERYCVGAGQGEGAGQGV